jgi:hypothetical protein
MKLAIRNRFINTGITIDISTGVHVAKKSRDIEVSSKQGIHACLCYVSSME